MDAKVGDTITHADRRCSAPLPGFHEVKPMVFSGIFPIDSQEYENLRDALAKLRLNDSAFTFWSLEVSVALGLLASGVATSACFYDGDRAGAVGARSTTLSLITTQARAWCTR